MLDSITPIDSWNTTSRDDEADQLKNTMPVFYPIRIREGYIFSAVYKIDEVHSRSWFVSGGDGDDGGVIVVVKVVLCLKVVWDLSSLQVGLSGSKTVCSRNHQPRSESSSIILPSHSNGSNSTTSLVHLWRFTFTQNFCANICSAREFREIYI